MDINSIISAQDAPDRRSSTPVRLPSKRPRKSKMPSTAPKIGLSPLSKSSVPPDNPIVRGSLPSSGLGERAPLLDAGARSMPPARPSLAPSTSGMDTLADLASMQHHQQTARTNAGKLRSAEVYDNQSSASTMMPSLPPLPRTNSNHRIDASGPVTPAEPATMRKFVAESVSEDDLQEITRLVGRLAENPFEYESHIQLIKILHQGFVAHVYGSSSTVQKDPRSYELLQDLNQAREAMDARFALGEDLWVDRLRDLQLLAASLDECLEVMEACQKAISEESGSKELWLLYGDWMSSLYSAANPSSPPAWQVSYPDKSSSWSEVDKIVAAEIFTRKQMVEIWKRGTDATKSRINDSHAMWDRYTELLLQDIGPNPSQEDVAAIREHIVDRLHEPHATWAETFQKFSHFISTYDNPAYEETMIAMNQQAADAKKRYLVREVFEVKLQKTVESQDKAAEWATFMEYLEWELKLSRKKKFFSLELTNALYQRAVIRIPTDVNMWEDYITFLIEESEHGQHGIPLVPVLERASRHCPWSGSLWAQYLQAAERESLPFEVIGQIKHRATSTGLLDAGGMEEILRVHTAWCGFLRRQAFHPESTDEDIDVAEVGIRSAIEDMETLGRQKYGEEYKGDPQYRLERMYVKFLGQTRNWNAARQTWKGLIHRHGNSYEFWLDYARWEMTIWGVLSHDETSMRNLVPTEVTKVLRQAVKRPHLDWPEKIIESYLHHCEDQETIIELQTAVVQTRKATKMAVKRRELEACAAAELARQEPNGEMLEDEVAANGKRKRGTGDDADGGSSKKSRPDKPALPVPSAAPKRDRENTTVVVENLPVATTAMRVRQYFRDCGIINSLKIHPDEGGKAATATIEFDAKEDALTAMTKEMKDFDGNVIRIQVGAGSTLFVTNFPPTADEAYIQELFAPYGDIIDVRFPSLKFNAHRRFCYVQFKSSSQAKAATELHGKDFGAGTTLTAMISDPTHKQDRHGALYDGREVYISNVDWSATEGDIREIFSKYGQVEKVRIPRNLAGKSKGMAFAVFGTKNEATSALDLNNTKFKSRILSVAISTDNPAKRHSTTVISRGNSPQTDSHSIYDASAEASHSPSSTTSQLSSTANPHPSRAEISARTITLLNIPDTVNDARIRALVEPYGALTKIILRPDHQGAIVEFREIASAGQAELGIEGHEIAPGRKVKVGTIKELFTMQPEHRSDRLDGKTPKGEGKDNDNAKMLPVGVPIRRPGQQKRGGLGVRRGRTGLGSKPAKEAHENGAMEVDSVRGGTEDVPKPRSNADFKAMFLKGGE